MTTQSIDSPMVFDRIVQQPYDPNWPADFQAIVGQIRAAFPAGTAFHHIGSTAVPGLAAKDIIDIQASVPDLADIDVELLEAQGFTARPVFRDHAPAGAAVVEGELAKRMFRGVLRPCNLHVRVTGAFNQRYPLLCRDYLRAHPVTAASYLAVKRHLSDWFPADKDRYYDIKEPVFDIIMDGAAHWARVTGWEPPKSDVVD